MSPPASLKGLSLMRSVHHDVPSHLQGDPGRLRQVLTQIVRRLVECMDRGEVSVLATLAEETPHGVTLRFSVSYSGHSHSMNLDELTQLFGSGVSKTTRKDAEALGMAISRQLVLLMGGKTGVETKGSGGSFWFQLPYKRIDAEAPASAARVEAHRHAPCWWPTLRWACAWIDGCSRPGAVSPTRPRTASMRCSACVKPRVRNPYRVALLDLHLAGLDGERWRRFAPTNPCGARC